MKTAIPWKFIAGFGLVLLLLPDEKVSPLSGLADVAYSKPRKKARSKKIIHMWTPGGGEKPQYIPPASASKMRDRAQRGEGTLYTLFAYSADDARERIARGEYRFIAQSKRARAPKPATVLEKYEVLDRLRPIREFYQFEVLPKRIGHEFTRSLEAEIRQKAYKALGVKAQSVKILKADVDKFIDDLKKHHSYIEHVEEIGVRAVERLKERTREYFARKRHLQQMKKARPAKQPRPLTPPRQLRLFSGMEPWQMTKRKWADELKRIHRKSIQTWNAAGGRGLPPAVAIDTIAARISLAERAGYQLPRDAAKVLKKGFHQLAVEAAVSEGKPIPSEVLAQYPDVAPRQQLRLFAGATANCELWQQVHSPASGGLVWRCQQYAPACEPQRKDGAACVTNPAAEARNQLRICTTFQKVRAYTGKMVKRCKKYKAVCTTGICLPWTIPTPYIGTEFEPSEKAVRELAKSLAEQETWVQQEAGPALAREILSRGGIAAYKGKVLAEEYRGIPLHLKNRRGLPLDEMAAEMGLDETSLLAQIAKAYVRKVKRRFSWREFETVARDILVEEHEEHEELEEDEGPFGQVQREMFHKLKRELVLTEEDPARSDDPVTICLERRGWIPSRVRELQASISEKMTPDLWTGKRGQLTGGEKMLQVHIDECLKRLVAQRRKPEPAITAKLQPLPGQMPLFPLPGQMPLFGGVEYAHVDTGRRIDVDFDIKTTMTRSGPLGMGKGINYQARYAGTGHPFWITRKELNWLYRKVEPAQMRLFGDLAGPIMTCKRWDLKTKAGKEYFRCAKFAPTCKPGMPCITASPGKPGRKAPLAKKRKALPARKPPPLMVKKQDLSENEWKVLQAFRGQRIHIDEVGKRSGLPAYQVSAALVMLELQNLAHQTAGKMFETTVI